MKLKTRDEWLAWRDIMCTRIDQGWSTHSARKDADEFVRLMRARRRDDDWPLAFALNSATAN